jgi:formate hydrogenlyase subunit 6/NADH:ubiquinone oxidoreductase subunit I
MICPAEACKKINIGDEIDRLAFWYDRCIFCGECAERCPFDAVTMTQEFELAAYDVPSLYKHPDMPESQEALEIIEKARERKRLKAQKAAEEKAAAEAAAKAAAEAPAEEKPAEDKTE